ncbi:MAG TPA: TatD family hydrolase [Candidatus Acidoferrales bacterium]|nr:TatD family hydrolase [Candidatus Acidoferrales bacterium]
MALIDAHAHLDRYGGLLARALGEIEENAIWTLANSVDASSYERNLEIAAACPFVLPTFGIHPKYAARNAAKLQSFGPQIERTPLIGEIGLDFYWVEDAAEYPAERKVFEYFLAAAREQKKAVNLHTKGAEREVLDALEHYGVERAIIHWYSGPLDVLRAMIGAGLYFTIGVEILFSAAIREIARAIPLAQILTETDNPGGLKWLRGTPGMPADLRRVVSALAELKGLTAEALERTVGRNFLRFIDNDPWLEDWRRKLA